ncbi:hypothetical protein E2C01_078154 [Portunus trituberculatus]|uniref:Uncharacterized protein n=1 Tax=Portunus trituberculatus TaxID=210409 RepID=A0A5B7ITE0_PORTR|nr:hypothetical protein [Portunus trituberculatus]
MHNLHNDMIKVMAIRSLIMTAYIGTNVKEKVHVPAHPAQLTPGTTLTEAVFAWQAASKDVAPLVRNIFP